MPLALTAGPSISPTFLTSTKKHQLAKYRKYTVDPIPRNRTPRILNTLDPMAKESRSSEGEGPQSTPAPGSRGRRRLDRAVLAAAACVLAAGILRFSGLGWDAGQVYHSDEANIVQAVMRVDVPRQMDPDLFVYNAVPIYLDAEIAQLVARVTGDPTWKTTRGRIALIAREVSATASTTAVALLFLLGTRLLSPWGGVLAAAFGAFCPGLVQAAHYGVTESLLVLFFLALALLVAVAPSDEPWTRGRVMLGSVVAGLAVGTKTSAVSFLLVPAVAWLLAIRERRAPHPVRAAVLFLGGTALTFFLVSPFTLLHFDRLRDQIVKERSVLNGTQMVWYTAPFLGTVRYAYEAKSLMWLAGPFLAVLGLVGIALWLARSVRDPRERNGLPLLLFSVAYLAYVGTWFAKFIRYLVPLLPVLCLAAAWLLVLLYRAYGPRGRAASVALSAFGVLASGVFSAAMLSIYLRPHTRLAASDWIYANVAPGSTIALEQLDHRVPAPRGANLPAQYAYRPVPCLQHDDRTKAGEIAGALAHSDVLVVWSRRCIDAIRSLKPLYPITNRYYSRLLDGSLGFVEVRRFASYPAILGWEIRDDAAEATFRVFDHPTVLVFVNRDRLPPEEIERRIER